MTTLETLRAARGLIDTPEKWCQHAIGYTADGDSIRHANELDAGVAGVSYCTFGAIRATVRCASTPVREANHAVMRALELAVFADAIAWNNAWDRTHAEVMAAFDRAIAIEEAKAQEFAVEPILEVERV